MSDVSAESAASSRIAQALRDDILSGSIEPGQRLRQEDIAERLGGSRLPVREALRILAAEGLVQIEPNKGARVPLLDPNEVVTLYRMRERLEPLALAESMANLGSAEMDEISKIQHRIEQGVEVSEFLVLDREFHMASYTGCIDDHLMLSVVRMWNATQHYRRAFMSLAGQERTQIVNAEHRLLIEAINRHDTEDAELYLLGHIRRTRKELVRHPEIFSELS